MQATSSRATAAGWWAIAVLFAATTLLSLRRTRPAVIG